MSDLVTFKMTYPVSNKLGNVLDGNIAFPYTIAMSCILICLFRFAGKIIHSSDTLDILAIWLIAQIMCIQNQKLLLCYINLE